MSASDKWPSSNRQRLGHLRGGDNRSTPKTGGKPLLPQGSSLWIVVTPERVKIQLGSSRGGAGLRNTSPKPNTQVRGPHPTTRPKPASWVYPRPWNPVRVSQLGNGAHPVTVNRKDNHGPPPQPLELLSRNPESPKPGWGKPHRFARNLAKLTRCLHYGLGGEPNRALPPGFLNISVPREVLVRGFRILAVLRLRVWALNPIDYVNIVAPTTVQQDSQK